MLSPLPTTKGTGGRWIEQHPSANKWDTRWIYLAGTEPIQFCGLRNFLLNRKLRYVSIFAIGKLDTVDTKSWPTSYRYKITHIIWCKKERKFYCNVRFCTTYAHVCVFRIKRIGQPWFSLFLLDNFLITDLCMWSIFNLILFRLILVI